MVQEELSIVVPIWNQSTIALKRMLYTLVSQTKPPLEIVIVDGGPDGRHNVSELCGGIVRIIKAYMPEFNLSRLFNIGIKRARGEYIMTTGNDRLFSQSFLEIAGRYISHQGMLGSTWGMLRENTDLSGDIFSRWGEICSCVIPGSVGKLNPGSLQITGKDWFHKVRGFDEAMPFAYTDSDIQTRATLDGLHKPGIPYTDAQILHQWHPESPLVASLGTTLAEFRQKTGIIRNPDGWGELPEGSPMGISFVLTWKQRDHKYLRCCLHSLSNQTVPPVEIIVADQELGGDLETLKLCNSYPLCRYIHAPHDTFNLSWGFNVGIKRAVSDFVITCGAEFVFAENYIEVVQPLLTSGIWLISENTPIGPEFSKKMLAYPNPSTSRYWGQPFTKFPSGLHRGGLFGATKAWFEKVHGYNEEFPFACADAELWQRANADGLQQLFVGVDKTQVFHLWHPLSKYLDLDSKYFQAYPTTPIISNLEGWGEL